MLQLSAGASATAVTAAVAVIAAAAAAAASVAVVIAAAACFRKAKNKPAARRAVHFYLLPAESAAATAKIWVFECF